MGKVLYNKLTGESAEYEHVDAREILAAAPDIYSETAIDPLDHDGNGEKGGSAPSTESGLAGMTVPQLKALAADRGIDLGEATKKADIIAIIEAAPVGETDPLDIPQDAAGGLTVREVHASLEGLGVDFDPTADVETKFALLTEAREIEAA